MTLAEKNAIISKLFSKHMLTCFDEIMDLEDVAYLHDEDGGGVETDYFLDSLDDGECIYTHKLMFLKNKQGMFEVFNLYTESTTMYGVPREYAKHFLCFEEMFTFGNNTIRYKEKGTLRKDSISYTDEERFQLSLLSCGDVLEFIDRVTQLYEK